MQYKEAMQWLYSFKQYGSKLGLERILYLVSRLDNPQSTLKVIHVTGTNGKGSVCNYIASILHRAGYSVGIYVSPHLQRFSERIVINNNEITNKQLTQLIQEMQPIVEDMIKQKNTPTFFEIVTALAFKFFHDQRVDFAVIEVGLGGRFDATNVVSPILTLITNVTLEHTQQLGETVESISYEKGGIIKESIPVITAAEGKAKAVITSISHEKNAPLHTIDTTIWERVDQNYQQQTFHIKGMISDYMVTTSMQGGYQGENIALALIAIEQLQLDGFYLTQDDIIKGVVTSFNPGRMEIVQKHPLILLDGAHNPSGMEKLKDTLEQDFIYDRLILIVGILKDKALRPMLSTIYPLAHTIICTQSENMRACPPQQLQELLKIVGFKGTIYLEPSVRKAIDHAKKIAEKNDLMCITGSLYTIGEARSYLTC